MFFTCGKNLIHNIRMDNDCLLLCFILLYTKTFQFILAVSIIGQRSLVNRDKMKKSCRRYYESVIGQLWPYVPVIHVSAQFYWGFMTFFYLVNVYTTKYLSFFWQTFFVVKLLEFIGN